MLYQNHVVPFNDFWMNCVSNTLYSIASTLEPSYKSVACLNDYEYRKCLVEKDSNYAYLMIEHPLKYQNRVLSNVIDKREPYYFKDVNQFTEELEDMIKNGQYPVLNVDLYYWIPNSLAWKQYHWYHYSLITGYDSDKSVYYVLDDDINGFREFEIPKERLEQAFLNSEYMLDPNYQEPPCYTLELKKEIAQCELSFLQVKGNAERIVQEISELKIDDLWDIGTDVENFDAYITNGLMGINIIESRQHGNRFLLKQLADLHHIDSDTFMQLDQQLTDMSIGWFQAKNVLIKAKFSSKRRFNRDQLIQISTRLLSEERQFWEQFIQKSKMIVMV
ncbi:hypothetical protein [Paenibacillus sp. IHBB 10380]|uniref:hypothetical protein n=1 Tax=Paenibacillus sp. IHBB 10380 TaxID=1566358 RepID=UPI0005CFE39E|nr:hypothetical protein [Paenibacillus sp. IHBB 10380]AJS60188.1 hypothetical protein UB51_18925 [Paenibacillus sp. IHBB 10380]